MLNSETDLKLYDELYERTKNFGRADFVKILMGYERENEKLKHYKKLYQILKREKEDFKQWVTDYRYKLTGSHEDGRYCVAISVTDILKRINEMEGIDDGKED